MRAKAVSGTPCRGQSAPDVLSGTHGAISRAPTKEKEATLRSGTPDKDALELGVRRLVSSVFWGSAQRGRKMDAAEVARLRIATGTPALPDPLRRSHSEDLSHFKRSSTGCSSSSGSSEGNSNNSKRTRSTSSTSSSSGGGGWGCPFATCRSLPAGVRLGHATAQEQSTHSDTWAWLHSSSEATLSEGRKWAQAAAQAGIQAWQVGIHETHSSFQWLSAPGTVLLQLLLSLLLLLTPTGLLPGVPQGLKFLLGLSLLSLLLIPSSLSFPGHIKPNTVPGTSQGGFSSANIYSLPDCLFPPQSQQRKGAPHGAQSSGGSKAGVQEEGASRTRGGVSRTTSSSSGHSGEAHVSGSPRVHRGGSGRKSLLALGISWKALSALLVGTEARPASLAHRVF